MWLDIKLISPGVPESRGLWGQAQGSKWSNAEKGHTDHSVPYAIGKHWAVSEDWAGILLIGYIMDAEEGGENLDLLVLMIARAQQERPS